MGNGFQVFSTIQGKQWPNLSGDFVHTFSGDFVPRLQNSYIHAHAPEVLAQDLTPIASKNGSHIFMFRLTYNPVGATLPLKKFKKKILRVEQYRSVIVSALTGSVPHKMTKGQQRVSAP